LKLTRQLMEIFAGFVEHVDVQADKVIDELDRLGTRDNTIVFYIFGDNGSISEGLAQAGRVPGTTGLPVRMCWPAGKPELFFRGARCLL
jgi:arylsulfatase A-like enzyme